MWSPRLGRFLVKLVVFWSCLFWAGPGWSLVLVQVPQPPQGAGADVAVPSVTPGDLTTRYRFFERYVKPDAAPAEGRIGPYQVAFRETIETVQEIPQAAPKRSETIFQARCTEQATQISEVGSEEVLSLARRYESLRIQPEPRTLPSEPALLDDLPLWIQKQPEGIPLVLNLSGTRPLTEEGYRFAAFRQIFLPDLAGALPELPATLGATWQLPRRATETLIGSRIASGALVGQLESVEPIPDSSDSRAVIRVSGRVQLPDSPEMIQARAAINARLEFTFPRPRELAEGSPNGQVIDARGAIVRLSLAQEDSGFSRQDGRTRASRSRELILERRLGLGDAPALDIPASAPSPTRENSWILHVDAEGRFHFSYPQVYQAMTLVGPEGEPEGVNLAGGRPDMPDSIHLQFWSKSRIKPEDAVQHWTTSYRESGAGVVEGQSGWLPETDWPNRRAYRAELALTVPRGPGGRPLRVFFNGYIIQFSQDASLYARAITPQEDPGPFRERVEEILQSVQPGTPNRPGTNGNNLNNRLEAQPEPPTEPEPEPPVEP